MLQRKQLTGALEGGDVAADAAIALEPPAFVQHRLGAERHPHRTPIVGEALDLEIAKPLVAPELGTMPVPFGLRHVEGRLVPALASQIGGKVEAGVVAKPARQE